MKFAYADPPYLGCGKKLYGKLHKAAADFDSLETHKSLIERLVDEFPDGWAMKRYKGQTLHAAIRAAVEAQQKGTG